MWFSAPTSRTHAQIQIRMMANSYGTMKIAVAGGTGFIGSRLVKQLTKDGNEVVVLAHTPKVANPLFSQLKVIEFNSEHKDNPAVLEKEIGTCDAVVNLAGEPIAGARWTPARKQAIIDSRVICTQRLVKAIQNVQNKPQVLVNGSAIGIYGISDIKEFDESSESGDDFLAEVCKKWEAAADNAGIRTVKIRTGIVLGKEGGALAKMLPIFNLGLGGPLGTGKQWVSWIHVDDEVGLIIEAIKNPKLSGPVNATSPNPVTFQELCTELGKATKRPSFLPAPAFALKFLLGGSSTLVLDGQKVYPKKASLAGYNFKYNTLDKALQQIVQQ